MQWTEANIANRITQRFEEKTILVVPNTSWTGSECDLLLIANNLKPIDIEIKISRSDLKADTKKSKWFHAGYKHKRTHVVAWRPIWPQHIWKHYYCLPADIWKPELRDILPIASGILLLREDARCAGGIQTIVERRAIPNKLALPITPKEAIDLARLTSLRYWKLRAKEQ